MIVFDDDAKKIGLVVADEKQATMEYFKDWHLVKLTWNKFEVYWANQGIINLYILFCGCGEVQAASGTQYLIDNFPLVVVVSVVFALCGITFLVINLKKKKANKI